ncbi:MAG TPA: type IV pilus twitching motility protein PilT [Chthoniobacteraceae bacterium]|nr:pilT 1 [Chthoniobacter sp.]HEV7867637.1 type IV pilus twitching motility protein PilT [Chthoniobacteraceae bacterium]
MALFNLGKTSTAPPEPNLSIKAGGLVPMEDLLRLVVDEGGSDLHLSVGAPPAVRLNGRIVKLEMRPLTAEDTETLARAITSDGNLQKVNEEGSVDFGFSFRESNRFRVSVYREKGNLALALRLIPRKMLSLEEIGMPAAVRSLLDLPRGLVLVTGPTGSGKSTSLASMLDVINATTDHHIITIEDPIEYFHNHQRGIVNQRELGVDVPSFADGLRRALRQDPDVILVGEMRDLETMETAITAAETGHLVFSTLHTTGAARTVDRIIDAFPNTQQEQIRVQLSTNLKAVLSQVLLPRMDKPGRIAGFELMINTPSIAALIRDNKTFRIANDILTGSKYGMVSLDASLANLYLEGLISYEQVLTKAQDPQAAVQLIGGQKPKKR